MRTLFLSVLCTSFLFSTPLVAFPIDETVKADRSAVRELQTQLNELGFDTGRPDGAFGRKTQAGIEAFAARFPTDGAEGLSRGMLARVAFVHSGRFGIAAEQGLVIEQRFAIPTDRYATTDIRDDLDACDRCTVTPMLLGSVDLNGDGADDVILHQHVSNSRYDVIDRASPLRIYRMNPKGAPTAQQPELMRGPDRVHAREAVAADFNADGIDDLFIAAQGLDTQPFPGEQNVLILSSPDGPFDASETHLPLLNDMAHGTAVGDIDADGDTDILVVTNQGTTRILPYLLLNDGAGRFEMGDLGARIPLELIDMYLSTDPYEAEYSTVRLIDIDADGALDLFLLARGETPSNTTRNATIRSSLLFYNDGDGHYSVDRMVALPTDRWGDRTFTNDADAIDLNGDGRLDLILTQSTRDGYWRGGYLQALVQTSDGWEDRSAEYLWPQGASAPLEEITFANKTTLVDFDNDGDLDLVTNTLNPGFRETPGEYPYGIGVNDGSGRFAPVDPRWISGGYEGRDMITGDFDGNNVPDIGALNLNYIIERDQTVGVNLTLHRPTRSW